MGEYLALGGGPPGFPQGSTCPAVLRKPIPGDLSLFAYGAVTLSGEPFQTASAKARFCNSLAGVGPGPMGSSNPVPATHPRLALERFGLCPFRSPLLRASRLLSFPRGTEMVHFPRFASDAYEFSIG